MDAGLATVLAAAVATFGAIIITIIQLRGFRQEAIGQPDRHGRQARRKNDKPS